MTLLSSTVFHSQSAATLLKFLCHLLSTNIIITVPGNYRDKPVLSSTKGTMADTQLTVVKKVHNFGTDTPTGMKLNFR